MKLAKWTTESIKQTLESAKVPGFPYSIKSPKGNIQLNKSIGNTVKVKVDGSEKFKGTYEETAKWLNEFLGLSLTARLDEIAGELEKEDSRLALALDLVSDRLELKIADDKRSFTDKIWPIFEKGLDQGLKYFQDQEKKLNNDLRNADFWKILDKAAGKLTEQDMDDKLSECPEWAKLSDISPSYRSPEDWRDDIQKLNVFVKRVFK